jgi:hypothetical protein
MPNFTAGTSFTDGVTNDVTAAKLNALVADAVPTSSLALASTSGTISNFTSSTATFLGAITGSTNVINIGSGQIYKDASGNVGVGTASPISSLHIKHATPTSKITLEDLSTNRVGQIGGGSDGDGGFLSFSVGNNGGTITERLRIDPSGNCSIGTATALSRLHVHGDLTLSNATTAVTASTSTITPPATVAGYLTVSINGTSRKIAYYAT